MPPTNSAIRSSRATSGEATIRGLSSPCSPCAQTSSAIQSGFAVPSATTINSLGPAIPSIPTADDTSRLASCTYRLPGPAIRSTRPIASVPNASAAIAWAPPTAYTSSHSGNRAGREHRCVGTTRGSRRGRDRHPGNPGHARRDRAHQDRGGIRRPAPRCVHADRRDRLIADLDRLALGKLDRGGSSARLELRTGHRVDVFSGEPQRVPHVRLEQPGCSLDRLGVDGDRLRRLLAQTRRDVAKRGVAALPNSLDNPLDLARNLAQGRRQRPQSSSQPRGVASIPLHPLRPHSEVAPFIRSARASSSAARSL